MTLILLWSTNHHCHCDYETIYELDTYVTPMSTLVSLMVQILIET